MSDRPPADETGRPTDDEGHEEASERALDRLLRLADQPPAISAAARERIGEALEQARGAGEQDQEKAAANRGGGTGAGAVGAAVQALWQRRRAISTAASALALAAAAALVIYWMRQTTELVHRNEGVGPLAVQLEDGTQAILDQGAELVGEGRRTLELRRGRVLLDVAEAAEPLVVSSPHGRVIALGTKMLVEAAAAETRAAVVRGSVRLESASGGEQLRAGEQGVLRDGAPATRAPAKRLSYLTSWARDAMGHRPQLLDEPIRRGTLVAQAPGWERQWPLPMRELRIDVVVEDGVARTTIDQTFFNRVDQRLEGRYSFPLPPDAAVSRLAMYVDGTRVEGGIVERQRGREIYESIVYLRRDPALLEWMAGNTFRIRIFPLEPRQEKRIILSYTQPLERLYDSYRLAVPIPELDDAVRRVRFDVRVAGGGYTLSSSSHAVEVVSEGADQIARFRARDHVVGDDLVLTLRQHEPPTNELRRFGDGEHEYLLARTVPEIEPLKRPPQRRRWAVLVDTSASRSALELRAQAYVVRRLIAEADEDDRIALLAFDRTVRPWQAGWLPVREVDAVAIDQFVDAELDERLGDTDLAAGLRAALKQLDEGEATADEQPTIVYLGDGLATGGERDPKALRQLVAGKAELVSIALGDEVDAGLLRSLAAATGGLFAHWQPSADLGWHVFDLLAALRTPRLLSLSAVLQDEQGTPVEDATAYLTTQQLAGGEAATVVARWPKGAAPTRLALSGSLAGRPWSQQVELAAAEADARYLPRLFARRHIEALTRQGAAEHREEITRLGLEQFLVTPFTSLLVLESEAMYRQFQVSRPQKDRWAPYEAPATIAVEREPLDSEPLAPSAEGQALILRTPVAAVEMPGPWSEWDGSQFGMLGLGNLGVIGTSITEPRRARRVRMGGLSGIGFGAGGTGRGFGSGHGRLGRAKGGARPTQPRASRPSVITTGSLRARVDALDWTSRPGSALEARGLKEDRAAGPAAAASAWDSAGPAAQPPPWRGAYDSASLGAPAGGDRSWTLPTRVLGRSVGHLPASLMGEGILSTHPSRWPVAFQHASDARLDDLTEFVPALFGDALDADCDAMAAERADGQRGSLSIAARELLERAAAAQQLARYELSRERGSRPQRLTLQTGAGGSFEIEQVTPAGLAERLVYDGTSLRAFYPELELAVERAVSLCAPAMVARLAPMQLPPPATLEQSYDVSLQGERTLRLVPLGKAGSAAHGVETIEISFDAHHRVASIRRTRPGRSPVETTLEYEGSELRAVKLAGMSYRVRALESSGRALRADLPEGWVRVRMPLRDAAYEQAQREAHPPGSAARRAVEWQLLATYAALGDAQRLWEVLGQLAEREGAPRRGELVLASRAVSRAADEEALKGLVGGLAEDVAVRSWLLASWKARRDLARKTDFDAVATQSPEGLVGMMAAYRALLEEIDAGRPQKAFDRYRAFVDRGGYAPLRFAALHRMTSRWRWEHGDRLLELWEALAADEQIGVAALLSAAEMAEMGTYDEPRKLDPAHYYTRAFQRAAKLGQYPLCDAGVRRAFLRSPGGQARWRLFWTAWREQLLQTRRPAALLALGRSMLALGLEGEYGLVATQLREIDVGRASPLAQAAEMLLQMDRAADAGALLEPHLPPSTAEPSPRDARLLRLASSIAERQGKLGEAAALLERSMSATAEALPLDEVRALFRQLFELKLRSGRDGEDAAGLQGALAVAARWRKLDPDHAEIDDACATALFAAGQPEQALRHLTSIIDRHPAEGEAMARVAEVLETQGRLAEGVTFWQRARAVEPTNPTWLLREAQAQLALGQGDAAEPLLRRIREGEWQERFDDVKHQARELSKWAERP